MNRQWSYDHGAGSGRVTAGAILGARAWADLFLLGLLAGTPRPAADLLAAIGRMPWVGPAARHLLSERLAALLGQDQIVTDGRSQALRPTPAGQAQIIRLLRIAIGSTIQPATN